MPESIETEFSNLIWKYRFTNEDMQVEHEKMCLSMYENYKKDLVVRK